jgi:hypothetical protein
MKIYTKNEAIFISSGEKNLVIIVFVSRFQMLIMESNGHIHSCGAMENSNRIALLSTGCWLTITVHFMERHV